MKKNYILAALAGAAVGSGITYLVVNKRIEAKYMDLFDTEIEAFKSYYFDMHIPEETIHTNGTDVEEFTEEEVVTNIALTREYSEDDKIDYASINIKKSMAEEMLARGIEADTIHEEKEHPGVEPDHPESKSIFDENTIEIIPVDTLDSIEGYDVDTLTYFVKDDLLVDSVMEAFDSYEDMVGEDTLNKFGWFSGDPNLVYVKNELLKTIFEIVRSEESYEEAIEGGPYQLAHDQDKIMADLNPDRPRDYLDYE